MLRSVHERSYFLIITELHYNFYGISYNLFKDIMKTIARTEFLAFQSLRKIDVMKGNNPISAK